ncbi:MAG TPA: ATP-binding protein, partial [Actinotalea sp.]
AADAAARSGVPGHLLLRLTVGASGATLVAANTGAPLDAEGVASLASLRASAKRDGATVGRFGVGFAAVRSVADEITVASTTGAVQFSLAGTGRLLADVPADLAAEVALRAGSLPILRLPLAGSGPAAQAWLDAPAADRWDTAVVLTLRDAAAVEEVRRQLEAVGDPVLLALPGLAQIDIEDGAEARQVRDVAERWVVASRAGDLDPRLLLDRPVEERGRTGWMTTWAAPRPGTRGSMAVGLATAGWPVHAPTPTDEPSTLPALLIGTFPLDPSRRHVAPGPLTDELVRLAGLTFADLLVACREAADLAPDPLDLLPPTLPAGTVDAALRAAAVAAVRAAPVLRPADGGPPLVPGDALVLSGPAGEDADLVRALSTWHPRLVVLERRHRHLVPLLGIGTADLAELVDSLPRLDTGAWTALLDALAGVDATTLEQLATLPVPLADGRTVHGARGLVLLDPGVPAEVAATLTRWGLRMVHPDAAHPLLERLGATRADSASLLAHPVVRERVLSDDQDDQDDEREPDQGEDELPSGGTSVADVVLSLVRAALDQGVTLQPQPWWGELLLADEDGEETPARGLVLPGSTAAGWFDPDILPAVDDDLAERWGRALEVVGVRTGLALVRIPGGAGTTGTDGNGPGANGNGTSDTTGNGTGDDAAGGAEDADLVTDALDDWDGYLDEVLGSDAEGSGDDQGAWLEGTLAVADLDAVRPEAWPEVLAALARGEARRALEPVRLPSGGTAPSYTAWWLRHRSGLGLDRPFLLGRRTGPLHHLLPEPPDVVAGLDVTMQRALGGIADPSDLDAAGWADLLDALPDEGRAVPFALAVAVWRGLAALASGSGGEVDAVRLPALVDDRSCAMVDVDQAGVGDAMWAQHRGVLPLLVVPSSLVAAVADVLDIEVAEDRAPGRVTSIGRPASTPATVLEAFDQAPSSWVEHHDLRVDGQPVDWWVTGSGDDAVVHASTGAGLALGLARVVGWVHRDAVGRLLTDTSALDEVLLGLAGEVAE